MSFRNWISLAGGAVALSSFFLSPTLAQVPAGSQIPPGETVETTGPATQFIFPAAQGLTAPVGSQAITFTLGTLTVDGGLSDFEVLTRGLQPKSGAQVSVADIYSFAAALQQAYLNGGRPLVRVIVPAQDLDRVSGNVKVQVISGFVESIDVSALPKRVQYPVTRLLTPLVGAAKIITAAELERRLLLAGETSGLVLRTALAPGSVTGATKLILTGEFDVFQSAMAIDNRLVEALGGEQITGSVSLNGLLSRGDRLVGALALAPDEPSLSKDSLRRYGSLMFAMPIGTNGLEIGAEILRTSSKPKGASAFLELTSEFSRASVFAALPLQRRRDRAMTAKLSFDAAFEQQVTGVLGFDVALFTDRTRVVRLGLEGFRPLPFGWTTGFDGQISVGIDGLGARSLQDASFLRPLSRLGADASFTRAELGFTLQRPLPFNSSIALTMRGQTGFGDALLRSEQGSIASNELISGLPAGSIIGDDTLAGRIELRHNIRVANGVISPYVFVAGGQAKLEAPTTLELPNTKLSGAGIGTEINFAATANQRYRLRLEWSETRSDDKAIDESNLRVSLVARF